MGNVFDSMIAIGLCRDGKKVYGTVAYPCSRLSPAAQPLSFRAKVQANNKSIKVK
jgi:hypothetical protein